MTFTTFLKEVRALRKKSEAARLQQMRLLVETKPMTAIWRTGPYTSWEAFLRGEHVCSVPCYNAFEQATQTFKKDTIDAIGVDCSVVLVRIEVHLRRAIFAKILEFIEVHAVPPNRQTVWSWVRSMRFIPAPVPVPKSAPNAVRH